MSGGFLLSIPRFQVKNKLMKFKTKHCCNEMKNKIQDIGEPLNYFPITREYALKTPGPLYPVGRDITLELYRFSYMYYLIKYCPFCKKKLAKSLRNDFFKILKKEYKINFPITHENEKFLPQEFKTNQWWNKRKL
jgi:hypothetical protein